MVEIFLWMKSQLSREDFELFAIRTWAVWHDKMRILHSNNQKHESIEVDWCTSLLQNYKNVMQLATIRDDRRLITSHSRWTRPETNCFIMNVDAAVNWESNNFSVGGVVRDHEGRMVLAFGRKISDHHLLPLQNWRP